MADSRDHSYVTGRCNRAAADIIHARFSWWKTVNSTSDRAGEPVRRQILASLALVLTACASTQKAEEPASVTADEQWVRSVCDPASIDSTGWRRHQLRNISISVPSAYRPGRSDGFNMRFNRGSAGLWLRTGRANDFTLLRFNQPDQVNCQTDFGAYPGDAVAYRYRGGYFATVHWPDLNDPDERPSVIASISATRLQDAQALLLSLHTIQRTAIVAAQAPNADTWFYSPCLSDSVDSFEWTRYDLHGIRIRVARDIRRVPYPNIDELRFKKGRAEMRLRLHNDASQLFTVYNKPDRTFRHAHCELAARLAETISFRLGAWYGYAALWPDADRGEWLTAVVTAPTLAEATAMRRSLFTISFAEQRR